LVLHSTLVYTSIYHSKTLSFIRTYVLAIKAKKATWSDLSVRVEAIVAVVRAPPPPVVQVRLRQCAPDVSCLDDAFKSWSGELFVRRVATIVYSIAYVLKLAACYAIVAVKGVFTFAGNRGAVADTGKNKSNDFDLFQNKESSKETTTIRKKYVELFTKRFIPSLSLVKFLRKLATSHISKQTGIA